MEVKEVLDFNRHWVRGLWRLCRKTVSYQVQTNHAWE